MNTTMTGSALYRDSNPFLGSYMDERVNGLGVWDNGTEAETIFGRFQELWKLESGLVKSYNEDELLDPWISEVLSVLDAKMISEATLPDDGDYVDRLLYDSDENRRAAAKRKVAGDTTRIFSRALAILEAKQWDHGFEKWFSEKRSYRDATHQLKHYLENTPDELQWGVEYLPAVRITDLSERETDLIKQFVSVAVEEASDFENFHKTALKTITPLDRLKAFELPDPEAMSEDLEHYLRTKERAAELDEKSESTDELIDGVIYDLYSLTEEKIDIVGEAVGDD